ncbi:MAG: histidine kinase [Bacteroidota bacterium]
MPIFGQELVHPFTTLRTFLAESVWRGGYFIMISFGYWFATNLIKIEKEKRKSEIALLKSQINPHFLFNSLNFFYSQIYNLSEKTAKGILLLSDIMRYSITDDIEGKVMLEEEVKHIKNFIEMKQLRFDNKLQVHFDVIGSIQFRMIIPLVLITLVENCFKHGDADDFENPISIRLEIKDDTLFFTTSNKKRAVKAEASTGMGIINTRKRLDAIYGNKYALVIKDEDEFYSYNLKIKL